MCRIAVICVHSCPLDKPGKLDAGGMNVYVRELSRELGKNGMTVDIFTRWVDPQIPRIVEFDDNARVIHLPAGPVERVHKSHVFQYLPEFICNLRRFKEQNNLHYRLLHSHYWLSGWVAGLLRQRWNVPHVAMFHTLGAVKNQARPDEQESHSRIETEHRIIGSADIVMASSGDERRQMVSLYGANADKIRIVPCGVDLTKFRPLDRWQSRRSLGLDGRPILLFVGRVEPLKGLDLLLDAVAQLDVPGLQLLAVGDESGGGGELARLHQQARALGIADKVSFVGVIERDLLPVYYNAADICVVPSHYESFSLVAAESLACGTPVVASPVGGLQSLVIDCQNGLAVPTRSSEDYARAIARLLADETLRQRLGRGARPSVDWLGWPAIGRQVLGVYDELADVGANSGLCLCGRW